MVKKKLNRSLFSDLVEQIDPESSSAEYHRVDNEYFAAFNSLDDIQKFHKQINEKCTMIAEQEPADNASEEEGGDDEMDMKSFAQQFLIDTHEADSSADQARKENTTTSVKTNMDTRRKRRRRDIRDLPHSSNFIFMSDDGDEEPGNIFDSLKHKRSAHRSNRIAYEDMSSILLTLDVTPKKSKKNLARLDSQEPTIAIELAEPSMIKSEPIEPEHVRFSFVEKKPSEPSLLLACHQSCDRSKRRTRRIECMNIHLEFIFHDNVCIFHYRLFQLCQWVLEHQNSNH